MKLTVVAAAAGRAHHHSGHLPGPKSGGRPLRTVLAGGGAPAGAGQPRCQPLTLNAPNLPTARFLHLSQGVEHLRKLSFPDGRFVLKPDDYSHRF